MDYKGVPQSCRGAGASAFRAIVGLFLASIVQGGTMSTHIVSVGSAVVLR